MKYTPYTHCVKTMFNCNNQLGHDMITMPTETILLITYLKFRLVGTIFYGVPTPVPPLYNIKILRKIFSLALNHMKFNIFLYDHLKRKNL